MKQGKPLADVLSELQRQNRMKRDYIAPAKAFRLEDDGETFTLKRNDGTEEMLIRQTYSIVRSVQRLKFRPSTMTR